MAIASESNVYGRMRQRIAAVGRRDRKKRVFALKKDSFAKDKSLRTLLQSGAVTHEQLENAISGFSKAPSDFLWLADVDEAVLGKADRVFFAKYGRRPVEDVDFRLNGDYHKICRSLQHDLHYYDGYLEEPSQTDRADVHTPVREPAEVGREKSKKKGIWAFAAVLLFGICSAPLLGMLIVTRFPSHTLTAGLLLGSFWLLILLGALALTLPR